MHVFIQQYKLEMFGGALKDLIYTFAFLIGDLPAIAGLGPLFWTDSGTGRYLFGCTVCRNKQVVL